MSARAADDLGARRVGDLHQRASGREPWWLVSGFAAALLVLRMAGANLGTFSEGDEISIAAGVAAVVRGEAGDAYRYGVQVGYYQLVAALTSLLGGRLLTIPDVMTWLSIVAGSAIPVVALWAFRAELSRGERWMLSALLAANPVIWQAARYGNTAIVSVALTVTSLVLLSNRPGRGGEVAAMVALAAAMFVRADAVLASPAAFAILWWTHRSVVRAAVPLVGCAVVVGGAFALLLATDPRMGDAVGSVAAHSANPITTRFLEFLLFGMAPVPLLMAAAGGRDLQRERPLLLAVLAAWIVPFAAFYYTGSTTPRYLMQLMPPLCIAAAVGVLRSRANAGSARLVSTVLVLGLTFVHLLVGLSDFSPGKRRSWLTDAILRSDDGPVYTGALLYKTYVLRPPDQRDWWPPHRFAPSNEAERSLVQLFDSLAVPARAGTRAVLVTAGGYGNELHYFAQVMGATVRGQRPGEAFSRETRFAVGGSELVTVGESDLEARGATLPVATGDEVWGLHPSRTEADRALTAALPAGLALTPLPDWPRASRLWRFRVAALPTN